MGSFGCSMHSSIGTSRVVSVAVRGGGKLELLEL